MKKNLGTVLLVLAFLVGLGLLLYPSLSNYWNNFHQSKAIASYTKQVSAIREDTSEKLREEAEAFNRRLSENKSGLLLSEEETEEYEKILDVTGTGIMSYIEIPKIGCALPIYHGTEKSVLQVAIGHIVGSSFPVGGESTHCVLSGHRGLPSAKLFTDIDQLVVGDEFLIRTLDETLTYEVDQILIVLPSEVDSLKIVPGEDLCTLVTCTPYGVNTHRLLVRGHRVETVYKNQIRVTADAVQVDITLVAPFIAGPILFILLLWLLLSKGKKR